MKTSLTLSFTAGSVNGKFMSLQVAVNNQPAVEHSVSDRFDLSLALDLPAKVEFKLSGKTDKDTQIQDGQIVSDKFVKLETIEIGNYQFESWRIPEEYLYIEDADQKRIATNYWGNGTACLIIDNEDPAVWFLNCPKFYS